MSDTRRQYITTHPWITFELDLRRLPTRAWLLLGEAMSKCQHIADSLLKPEAGQQLLQLFLAKGAHATTAIEGNTLSEEDALKAVQGRLELPRSQQYLQQEIENVIDAANEIKNGLTRHEATAVITRQLTEYYNAKVLRNLPLDDGVVPGVIRNYSVGVARYRGAPSEDCPYLVERLCEWLNASELNTTDPERRVPYAVIKAIIAHLYIAWIHPFGDGNGRTARLLEVQILLAAELPTPAAHLLSNHYNLTRSEYYRQLDQAGRTGDPIPFIEYAVAGFVDGLRDALRVIRVQQFADRWEQYVYETFGELRTESDRRRIRLVLDVSTRQTETGIPVPKSEMRRLTPRLAEAYSGKTDKTVSRDLNAILQKGLFERVEGGYVPRDWILMTFLPERRDAELAELPIA